MVSGLIVLNFFPRSETIRGPHGSKLSLESDVRLITTEGEAMRFRRYGWPLLFWECEDQIPTHLMKYLNRQ